MTSPACSVHPGGKTGHAYSPPAGPVRLHFRDEALIVADKPAGLLSVPGRGTGKVDCLEARLAGMLGWVRAVHRLDMDTSGLILLACTAAAHRTLSAAFASRSVEKTYVALVDGVPAAPSGRIDAPLVTDWPNRPRQKIDLRHGKPARTDWQRAAADGDIARLMLHPITGRSHQLRVHLASIGHPILGDAFYAPPAIRDAAPRLMLHAAALAFRHPVSGARLAFRSPPAF